MSERIFRIQWSLLAEFWCLPQDASEDEVVDEILKGMMPPTSDRALVKDRCYGGWRCAEPGRCHVLYNTGQYTCLGVNEPLSAEKRKSAWDELLKVNGVGGENGFTGKGPFCADAPTPALVGEEAKP